MAEGSPRPVIIDTDPGIDDALALMLALRSPEIQVQLLTTVAGNVPVTMGTANAVRLLDWIHPESCPILVQGADRPLQRTPYTATAVHGDDGLGGMTTLRQADGRALYPAPPARVIQQHAVSYLLQCIQQYGPALTVVALGPLTNIALALQQDVQSMRQLGQLIIMGGAIGVPGNVTPVAEFNIFADPHAADIVFTSGLPITLIPLDVTRQVLLTADFLQHYSQNGETFLGQVTRHLTRQFLETSSGPSGMPMHDPLAVAVALEPSLVHCETLPIRVETEGQHTLGMTVADQRPGAPRWGAGALLSVALEVDAERMLELFARRVLC